MSKKNNVMLSISLIVKNEEENLARCLDSLKSIIDALPCQLIITDTGSTDKTVEIAKDYTDEVYLFEWCDDFAAARNFGLQKAKGQWFMFIDADEWFEDAREIIAFFKSADYKKYNSASYLIRNYISRKDERDFVDARLIRLYNLQKGIQFIGQIHEYIPIKEPTKLLKTFAHHYSYANDNNVEFRKQKYIRNIKPLLQDFEKESGNIRTRYLMAQEYKAADEFVQYEHIIEDTFELIKDDIENPFYPYFLKFKTKFYKEKEPQKGILLLEKYFKISGKEKIWDLDLIVNLADLCHKAKKYEEAIKYCDKYIKLFDRYLKGKVPEDLSVLVASPLFISREFAITVTNLKVKCLLLLDKKEEALEEMKKVDFEIIPLVDLNDNLNLLIYCAAEIEMWTSIPEKYAEILKSEDSKKIDCFINILEIYILKNTNLILIIGEVFLEASCLKEHIEDNYVMLQYLRYYIVNSNEKAIIITKKFFRNNKNKKIQYLYSEFIMYAILRQEPIDDVLENVDVDDIKDYIWKIFTLYTGLADGFYNAFTSAKFGIEEKYTKVLYWKLCIMERCVLISRNNDKDLRKKVFGLYLELGIRYLEQIYNANVLHTTEINVLPRSFRFIYFAHKAKMAIGNGDFKEGLEFVKKAAESYPILAEDVTILLEKIKEKQLKMDNAQKSEESEFEHCAKSIKEKIMLIAESGMRDEAIKLLNSYIKINPNDKQGITEVKRNLDLDN